jgi:hypothetical protein
MPRIDDPIRIPAVPIAARSVRFIDDEPRHWRAKVAVIVVSLAVVQVTIFLMHLVWMGEAKLWLTIFR